MTPKVVIVLETGTVVPATFTDVAGGRDQARCVVLNQIASDLSGFKDKPFKQKKQWRADKQFSSWLIGMVLEEGGMEMNS